LLERSLDFLAGKHWSDQILGPGLGNPAWRNRILRRGAHFAGPGAKINELAFVGIAVLICLRCGLAAALPLSFDEAYYWLWSKHLALGYFEHPAAIAIAIRAGTFLFGDTEFGVRFIPLVLAVVASLAVWRAATIILCDEAAGAIAVLLFNCTVMIAAESLAATPDALLIAASALVMWAITELEKTQKGRWWLAAGAAMGMGIAAKYTGFFLCGSIAIWLASRAVGAARPGTNWLCTPWPYAGAAIALTMFAPTLYWNATHAFVSFHFQFGRVAAGHADVRYLIEFLGGQMALASPGVLVLAGIALYSSLRSPDHMRLPLFLLLVVSLPLAYFTLHSLHDRVQANWPCLVYPGLAVMAAAAFTGSPPGALARTRASWLVRVSAVPISCTILAVAYVQAYTGLIPMGRSDPIARMMGVGFPSAAETFAANAVNIGARAIVTTNYPVTSWLKFYERSGLPVIQIGEDWRFLSSPGATRDDLGGNLLYVTQHADRELPFVLAHFSRAIYLGKVVRSRNGTPIDAFDAFAIGSFHGAVVGRAP